MIEPRRDILTVGMVQMAPVWLDRDKTLEKMLGYFDQAVEQDCDLIVFGEAILPGYPFWLERTDGARFNSQVQKDFHARYLDQAIQIERGDLRLLCERAAGTKTAVYTGTIERAADRGGHSLYCSLVYIDAAGEVRSVHRKLMPTYEERLSWSPGDGHGLRVHSLGAFTVGGLNCWENWMPLPRAALYGLGEDLHVAVWPGAKRITEDITRFIAREGRSFVVSVSGLMRRSDIPDDIPHHDSLIENTEEVPADGGSCIAGPDGKWVIEPVVNAEKLVVTKLDHTRVREERQNFDAAGHYSRPDVTRLIVNRTRQSTVEFEGE